MVTLTFLSSFRKLGTVFALAILALPLAAQTGLGVITGTVRDATKAVVPNAPVKISNTATGVTKEGTANQAGVYYFGSLVAGPYHVQVDAAGFQKWEVDVRVDAGETVTLDAPLDVNRVQTRVQVSDAAAALTTEGAQLSDFKTAQEIHDLPLNGRQITNLFSLTPGIEGGQNTQGAANPRTNGMMVGATDILIDGQSYVDRFGGGISRVQPGLDTVQEYRVETSGSGASFDRPATVELVTRSGTNQFHGALFETFRNNFGGLEARQIQSGNTPTKLIRNEFGGFVGGPVIKNKLFFFYDQEALRQSQQLFSQIAVPTAANWGGNFSNEIDQSGDQYTIYNPYTTTAIGARTPFAGNQIPSSMINTQVTNAFKSVSPLPAGPNASANPWIGLNYQTTYPQSTKTGSLTARIDQVFGPKDNVSFRFTRSTSQYLQAGGLYGFPPPGITDGPGTSLTQSHIYNTVFHYTRTFTPTLFNDLQIGYMRSENGQGTGSDNVNWDSKLGLPNPFGATGWPTVYTDAYNMFYYGGWDNNNHKAQNQQQYELDDNVTWVKGKHTFKFGFKGRQEYTNVEELQQAQGSEFFDSNWTGLYDASASGIAPFTGSGLASLELGLPGYLSNEYNRGFFYFKQTNIGAFGEDTWKVTPKLTLSLGLRWDIWTPYHERDNRIDNINLNSLSPTSMQVVLPGNTTLASIPGLPAAVVSAWQARGLTAVSANSIGFPSALNPISWKDFSPHVAAAYRLTDKWVIRAGYGSYYWPMPLSQLLQSMRLNPPLNLVYQNNVDAQNGNNGVYSLTVVPAATDMLGAGGQATVSPSGVSSAAQNFLAMDVNHWADDHAQQWTFAVERELGFNTLLKLAYVGNHGSNLQQNWDINAPVSRYNYLLKNGAVAPPSSQSYLTQLDPNWSLVGGNGVLRHDGYSNANSVQAILSKRFSAGLSFQFSYVYTHAMTTNDSGGYTSGGGSINANNTGSAAGTSGSVPANSEILGYPNLSDSQRLRLLYTNSSQVPPQRITWTGIYQLPFGKSKKFLGNAGRALDAAVGGWQLAWVGTWDGGFWIGNSASEYQFGNPVTSNHLTLTYNGQRQLLWFAGDFDPKAATNVNLTALEALVPASRGSRAIHPVGTGFNNLLTQYLPNGTAVQTNITDNVSWNRRNYMLGPKAWDQDLSLFKYFTITERLKIRINGDFFNAFNHPLLGNPNSTTGLINLSQQPNAPRVIQLGARLEF